MAWTPAGSARKSVSNSSTATGHAIVVLFHGAALRHGDRVVLAAARRPMGHHQPAGRAPRVHAHDRRDRVPGELERHAGAAPHLQATGGRVDEVLARAQAAPEVGVGDVGLAPLDEAPGPAEDVLHAGAAEAHATAR
jgi:hypothetical protein